MLHRRLAWIAATTGLLLTAVLLPAWQPLAAEPGAMVGADAPAAACWHEVAAGEDLRSIARFYYGSARLWRTLQVANDVGLQPQAGARIWIPAAFPDQLTP